jgi:hypothetical protein
VRPIAAADRPAVARLVRARWGSDIAVVRATVFTPTTLPGIGLLARRPGAVAASRARKPEIPETGAHRIPLRDELEREREV